MGNGLERGECAKCYQPLWNSSCLTLTRHCDLLILSYRTCQRLMERWKNNLGDKITLQVRLSRKSKMQCLWVVWLPTWETRPYLYLSTLPCDKEILRHGREAGIFSLGTQIQVGWGGIRHKPSQLAICRNPTWLRQHIHSFHVKGGGGDEMGGMLETC